MKLNTVKVKSILTKSNLPDSVTAHFDDVVVILWRNLTEAPSFS